MIQQRSKCYNTLATLDIDNLNPISIKYSDDTERKEFSNGFEEYFHNSDEKVCPIKSCKLLGNGCKSSFGNN